MLWNLLLDILITPENVIGFILNISMLVSMCLIFTAWKENWWKSLIPFYSTYIIYKHTWKNRKMLFIVQLVLEIVNKRSVSVMRKHIITNLFDSARELIVAGNLNIQISASTMSICLSLFLISALVLFFITRLTYLKICDSLDINNMLIQVGVVILPEIFLIISYISYKRREKKNEKNQGVSERKV